MNNDKKHDGGDEHGRDKGVTLIVNAREKKWDKKTISFEEVIELAFGSYSDEESIEYTVSYAKGEDRKEGTLTKGESVKVKDGMVFNVKRTDRS